MTAFIVLTAGLAGGVEAVGAAGAVWAAGAVGVAPEVPFDCAKAGPAISAVATNATANFFNILFSLLFRGSDDDIAPFSNTRLNSAG
ncbi:MAG TPA: hypothetical protein VJ353_15515 [Xanthobacteraceae bacterium]|nr:hypothetical protein [Xanthobacteraceae bacterium]